jgi:hypothetical protein
MKTEHPELDIFGKNKIYNNYGTTKIYLWLQWHEPHTFNSISQKSAWLIHMCWAWLNLIAQVAVVLDTELTTTTKLTPIYYTFGNLIIKLPPPGRTSLGPIGFFPQGKYVPKNGLSCTPLIYSKGHLHIARYVCNRGLTSFVVTLGRESL